MPYTHRRAGALIPAQHVESRHDSVSLRLATWDAIATLRVAYRLVAFRSSTSAWLHASAYVWPLIEGPPLPTRGLSRPFGSLVSDSTAGASLPRHRQAFSLSCFSAAGVESSHAARSGRQCVVFILASCVRAARCCCVDGVKISVTRTLAQVFSRKKVSDKDRACDYS